MKTFSVNLRILRTSVVKLILIVSVFFLFFANITRAQNIITHDLPYQTHNQNMWGPSWEPFTLDFDWDIFHIYWDTSYSYMNVYDIFGEQFGIGFQAGTWGEIGMNFSMHGFTTGYIDINYPVQTNLTFPNPLTFDHGETVTIGSNYSVQNGWYLDTHYPNVGTTTLWLDFGLGANIDFLVCSGECDTINIIEPINIPVDSITIFHIDSTGSVVYPMYFPDSVPQFQIVHDSVLPVIIDDWFNIGLTGAITLPYVMTTDWLDTDQCLYASGDSTYLQLNLNIITFLTAVAGLIPPPQGPAIVQALGYLNGSMDIPIGANTSAHIVWSIITASFYMSSTQQQDFTFCPTIWANLSFPTDIAYTETDPSQGNAVVSQGMNDTIAFVVNNDLHITYPCHGYDTLPIGIEYTLTNDFTNHTWDSIAFGFQFQAMTFSIHIPTLFMAIPPSVIPEFCLPSVDTNIFAMNGHNACMQGFITPGVTTQDFNQKGIQDFDFNIGPLFQDSIPLGYLPLTWYNNTWNMEGFTPIDTVMSPTFIVPNPELDATVTSAGTICFGDATGTIVVTAINGRPPYTFSYPNGDVNTHISTVDSTHIAAGTYTVTVSDAWSCEVYGEVTVIDIHPPIVIGLVATEVLCKGDSTGLINSTVSGGVPGFTYFWFPSGQTIADPVNLWAGNYHVTVTDAIGCKKYDSIIVSEPLLPITITDFRKNISCKGGNDGSIDITIIGGTPPYSHIWSTGMFSEDLVNLAVGTYTISVTDANLCLDTHIVVLTEPLPLQINVTHQDVSCYHFHDGSIDITVSGGTVPYSYLWNNNAITEDLNGLMSGLFTVTVIDSLGCKKLSFADVLEPTLPLTVKYVSTHVKCHGESTGTINLNVTGGTASYAFEWSNGDISQNILGIVAGAYSVTVTDAHSCDTMVLIHINEPLLPLTVLAVKYDVLCFGGSTGSINLTVSGGVMPYNYLWNNGAITEDLSGLPQGAYSVKVNDANGCIKSTSIFVDQPQKINLVPCQDPWLCYGQSTTLSVALYTGGVQPFDFVWSNGVHNDSLIVTPTQAVSYSVRIIDANGCMSVPVTINIKVDKPLTMNLFVEKDTVCINEKLEIQAAVTGGGGEPYMLYINDTIFGNPPVDVYPERMQYYYGTVYDRCHFDSIRDSILIHTYPLPPLNMKYNKASGCQPFTVHFIEGSVNQGQNYLWDFDDGDVENISFEKNPTHTFHNAVTYNVKLRVTSQVGCIKESDTALITVFPKPDARFVYDPQIVYLSNPLVRFTNLSNGYDTLQWYFGDNTHSTDINPEHVYENFGYYKTELFVKSTHDCVDTADAEIFVEGASTFYAPGAFTPNNDGINETFCVYATGYMSQTFTFFIYNRWGEIIFKSNNVDKGWDGKEQGGSEICPSGNYIWFASFKDANGNTIKKSGNVVLVK